jgi:hypothetical protein
MTKAIKVSRKPRDTEPDEGPFERFEALARRLVRVPKKELDRRSALYERRKQNGS